MYLIRVWKLSCPYWEEMAGAEKRSHYCPVVLPQCVQVGFLNFNGFEDDSDHQLGLRTIGPLLRPYYSSQLASLVMYSLIYFYSKKNKII